MNDKQIRLTKLMNFVNFLKEKEFKFVKSHGKYNIFDYPPELNIISTYFYLFFDITNRTFDNKLNDSILLVSYILNIDYHEIIKIIEK